jgi:tetratricopeptide (TPR) repeat protein
MTTPTQQLLDDAYLALDAEESERALEIGKKLLELKQVRGFEVVALALEQQGKYDEAISALQSGVTKASEAFPLWQLLGNLLSERRRFTEAREAYQRALTCNGADQDAISYDMAVMLSKANQPMEAMQLCDSVSSPAWQVKVRTLRSTLLNTVGRYEEAAQIANGNLTQLLSQQELAEDEMQDLAQNYSELGRSYWLARKDGEAAFENACRALEWDRADSSALWLIRELMQMKTPASRWFRLEISGQWHFSLEPDQPPPPFIGSFDIVADTVEDALRYAQNLEPPEIRETMLVTAIEDKGPYADHLQGIYWRSPYAFLTEE